MDKWIVGEAEDRLKLFKFLKSKYDRTSLKQIKKLLEQNACTVNGVVERFASVLIHQGDLITFKLTEITPHEESFFLKQNVLYEDEDLFVYNKPSGITSDSFKTKILLIHRLDKETTGVLMFAKNKQFLDAMISLFRKHLVKKVYLALVDGKPTKKEGQVDNYLGKKHAYEGQSIWGSVPKEKGLHAITEWKVEKSGNDFSLLKCIPKTGRTHQIRVHLSEMQMPILGDYHYCKQFKSTYEAKRCLLHALKVSFIHPRTGLKIEIEAPLPADFLLAVQEIK